MEPTDEAVLSSIVELAFDVVMVIDADGKVAWRHRSTERWPEGARDENIVGASLIDRIHPDDLPTVLDGLSTLATHKLPETHVRCRVFDAIDPSILHETEVRAFDAHDVPGVGGTLVLATVNDSRRPTRGVVGATDLSLADVMPFGLSVISADDHVIYANEIFVDLVGLRTGSTAIHSPVTGLDALLDTTRRSGSDQRTITFDHASLRLTGRRLEGEDDHVVVSVQDITAESEAIDARALSEQTLRAAFQHTPAGIALVTPRGRFVDVNPAWLEMTGFDRDELIGAPLTKISDLDETDLVLIDELSTGERESFRVEKLYRHRTGRQIWVDLWVSLVRDADDRPQHFICQVIDITQTKRHESEMLAHQRDLTHRATHDHLTGLANRAYFEENLRLAVHRMQRGRHEVVILVVDLDRFKPINDTLGHQAGDLAIREVAQRLVETCRESDIVARLGGDEFGIIAETTHLVEPGKHLSERIIALLAEPLESIPERPSVSASVGVAVVEPGDSVEQALKRADQAVYVAKRAGGNGYTVWNTSMRSGAADAPDSQA